MSTLPSEPFFYRRRVLISGLLLVLITGMIFWQVRHCEFISYDDSIYVYENPAIQDGLTVKGLAWALTTTYASNWHPLTWVSHMLDIQFFGLKPAGHHIVNLLLHLANVLLLFLVLHRMTGRLWQSAFVAALFALHPLHVESVAWVAERKDLLCGFFWMLTLWTYVFNTEKPGWRRYGLMLLFFALGLSAKPMAVTLPFVLLLLDYWPLKRLRAVSPATADKSPEKNVIPKGKKKKRGSLHQELPKAAMSGSSALPAVHWPVLRQRLLEKIPLFILTAASCVMTYIAQQRGGAVQSMQEFPLVERFFNTAVSYVLYIGKTLWPTDLAVLYPHPLTTPLWQFLGARLLLLLISLVALRLAIRFPYVIVGWLWYLGTLVPAIGLVQVGVQSTADRYTYIPLIGLFMMVSWGVPDLVRSWRRRRLILAVGAGIVLSALAIGTWQQLSYWRDSITLFTHTLKVTTNNYVIHYNLGSTLDENGKTEEAIRHYQEALRIRPDDYETHYNYGNSLAKQGHYREAVVHYGETIKIRRDYAPAHVNMGNALTMLGQMEEAIIQFREALIIQPDLQQAQNNMARLLAIRQKAGVPIPQGSASMNVDANDADAQMRLGLSLIQKGKIDEAVTHFQRALQINPRFVEAHISLGMALASRQKFDQAIDQFQHALKINPNLAEVHNSLGMALIRKGRKNEAIAHFREALNIKPNYKEAKINLDILSGHPVRSP